MGHGEQKLNMRPTRTVALKLGERQPTKMLINFLKNKKVLKIIIINQIKIKRFYDRIRLGNTRLNIGSTDLFPAGLLRACNVQMVICDRGRKNVPFH